MVKDNKNSVDYRAEITTIRHLMNTGKITYTEAQAMAKPVIDAMNARGEQIAKEHGVKYKKLTFSYVMR